MGEHREYIVTLKQGEDLDAFYDQMESHTGSDNVPHRCVECVAIRPNSRNTHYLLTDAEAAVLRQDPRVIAVELLPHELGFKIHPLGAPLADALETIDTPWSLQDALGGLIGLVVQDPNTQTFNKSNIVSASYVNWGLLRCYQGQQIASWGSDAITSELSKLTLQATGRNVDVIISDGGNPDPNHPEYAKNYDGTGGSRMISYDWYQLDPIVKGTAPSGTYAGTSSDHASHVTGIATGNRQGWARGANIYNIDYNVISDVYLFDYIKAFHQNKPVNPLTGLRNPTIVNCSWQYAISYNAWSAGSVSSVNYRGSVIPGPFTSGQLASYGLMVNNNVPVRYPAVDADIQDMLAAGVILVGAAGNSGWKHDLPGGADWNNTATISGSTYYYMRGGTPTANDTHLNPITIGCTNLTSTEAKAYFSDCGPGVDLFAPGYFIMSPVTSGYSVKTADSRNASYYLSKMAGTSMASPQVTGVLACALELYPRWKQSDAKAFILACAKPGQLTTTNGGYSDTTDLQGSANLHLYYQPIVPTSGQVIPTPTYGLRPSSGQVFPRPRIFRYGS